MPSYSWMFDQSAAKPKADALDLVAYVRSLGRERNLAGEPGNEQVDHGTAMEMSSSYGSQGVPDTIPRITAMGLDTSAPVFAQAQSPDPNRLAHGMTVYQHNCSGCHGLNADGMGFAAAGLSPKPVNLHQEHFSDAHLATVLWDGVYGSSMPAWRQLEKHDLEDVTTYIQALQAPELHVALTPGDAASAGEVYAAHCVSCHGADGRGQRVGRRSLEANTRQLSCPSAYGAASMDCPERRHSRFRDAGMEDCPDSGPDQEAHTLHPADVRTERSGESTMINIIVAIVTVIAAGFLLLWIVRPSFRKWVEQPKYTMLENDRRFDEQERAIPKEEKKRA